MARGTKSVRRGEGRDGPGARVRMRGVPHCGRVRCYSTTLRGL